uniref:polyribonucleotide nucleotidyltransferase n=3 Tax=Rhodosorus marinus TaxID=101924 RepID=A0A7S3EFZ5_9RHOD|mmetsp:Transcript_33320/g.131314  ORF Transcript_33320/g.131314 Transcript_33320/m.131314 type:complete len:865 (+) Transcript_33320:157-2751(+)
MTGVGFLQGPVVVNKCGGRNVSDRRKWRGVCSSSGRVQLQIGSSEGEERDTELDLDDEFDEDVVVDTDELELKRREHLLENDLYASPSIPAKESTKVSVEVGGKVITFETGMVARQAAGSVIVRSGNSMILCTACAESTTSPSADFLPMRVDYSEKFSAIGKTIGTYLRREGKPSEREVLTSRLIDRPLRPMFQNGFFNEVQVLASVFAYDGSISTDSLAICGCAAAIHISSIPLVEPVAAVRLAHIDGNYIINPSKTEVELSRTDLVVAGTRNGILMIEGTCDFLTEEELLRGLKIAQESISKICGALDQLRIVAGKEKMDAKLRAVDDELLKKVEALTDDLDEAVKVTSKRLRDDAINEIKDRVFTELAPTREQVILDPEAAENLVILQLTWKKHIAGRMRRLILDEDRRPDGRNCTTVRPIHIVPSFLPTAHGSALFTRGETQTLAVVTLGGDDMAMKQESIDGDAQLRFYLQYSFPPFSVGEVGRVGAPGRREVGHGKLAERSLQNIIPNKEKFPYVIRIENNILESNGSSSMASVCGGCLAMMDAGVPIDRPVAGVAMGLILEGSRIAVLTDILGMEDALGDMDFKVSGDGEGISALQMDVKVEGITPDVIATALAQAKKGRLDILSVMKEAMPSYRESLPESVPKIHTMSIAVKKIGEVIGPGGKQIKSIIEQCGGEDIISISISQDGVVSIMSTDLDAIAKAVQIVEGIAVDINVGQRFTGKVTKTLPFGAYIEILPGKEAWCHISELEYKRTEKVEDVCKEGDILEVEISEVGRGGQFRVSRKPLLPKPPPRTPENSVNSSDANGKDQKSKTEGKELSSKPQAKDKSPQRSKQGERTPRPQLKDKPPTPGSADPAE